MVNFIDSCGLFFVSGSFMKHLHVAFKGRPIKKVEPYFYEFAQFGSAPNRARSSTKVCCLLLFHFVVVVARWKGKTACTLLSNWQETILRQNKRNYNFKELRQYDSGRMERKYSIVPMKVQDSNGDIMTGGGTIYQNSWLSIVVW